MSSQDITNPFEGAVQASAVQKAIAKDLKLRNVTRKSITWPNRNKRDQNNHHLICKTYVDQRNFELFLEYSVTLSFCKSKRIASLHYDELQTVFFRDTDGSESGKPVEVVS